MTNNDHDAPALRNRIYLSVNGEGYGHSSRAIAIARHLKSEEVLVGSYNYALERIRSFEIPTVEVPQELAFIGADGRFDVAQTILRNPSLAFDFNKIVQHEMEVIKEQGICVVVADGRMSPVLAAARLDVPCIVLTNQSAFYPFFERESELIKLFGRSFEYIMNKWMRGAEEIFIPDLPPPNTICLLNLSADPRVKMRTRFVGPLTAWRRDEISAAPRDSAAPLIVVSLGGHEYRKPLFDAVVKVGHTLKDHRFMIFSTFKVDAASGDIPSNVQLQEPVKDVAPWFKAADVVITQAGHSTAMELVTLGKPSIIIPDTNQIEQENNAKRMQALQISIVLTYPELADPEQFALKRALELVLSDPSYGNNAKVLADEADRVGGAAATAALLRHYALRLTAY